MRKRIVALLLALLLIAGARAEARYTLPDEPDEAGELMAGELYFHALPDCGGVPRPVDAGSAEERRPCPVCVPDAAEYPGLELYEIGGLTVIRMSDAFMAARDDVGGVFGFTSAQAYSGAEAEARIAEYLHGAAYAGFRRAMAAGGGSAEVMRVDSLMTPAGDFDRVAFAAPRHIGAAWVEVFPPVTDPGADQLNPRFFGGEMIWRDGTLSVDMPREWDATFDGAAAEALEAEPVCEYEGEIRTVRGGRWALEVYRVRGLNIVALRLSGEDAMFRPDIALSGPEWREPIVMTDPHRDGEAARYGCALTDAEADRLIAGGPFVDYADMSQIEPDYRDTAFGVGITDGWEYYVADRSGRVLLPPEYDHMDRTGDVFLCRETLPDTMGDCRYTVYDAARERTLMTSENMILMLQPFPGGFFMPEYNRVRVARAGGGAPLAELAGRKGYDGVTEIALWGDPDVYAAARSKALEPWFSWDGGQPEVPEGALVGCVCVDECNCAFFVWSLDGGDKPTAEALGLADRAGAPLKKLESGTAVIDWARARRIRREVRDALRALGGEALVDAARRWLRGGR